MGLALTRARDYRAMSSPHAGGFSQERQESSRWVAPCEAKRVAGQQTRSWWFPPSSHHAPGAGEAPPSPASCYLPFCPGSAETNAIRPNRAGVWKLGRTVGDQQLNSAGSVPYSMR
jgi:hypothetical protein